MPFSIAVVVGSALSRPLATWFSDRRLGSLGFGGIAVGNLVLAATAGSVAGVIVGVVLAGVGLGVAAVAANSIGTRVSEQLTASAAGLLNTAGQLGTALGVAALVTVASLSTATTGTAIAWAGVAAAATLTALALARRTKDVSGEHSTGRRPPPATPT